MSDLKLEIISPAGILFKGECAMAVLPSVLGDIGVMYGHESVIAMLRSAEMISIYDDKQNLVKSVAVTTGGFAEMQGLDKLLVLVD